MWTLIRCVSNVVHLYQRCFFMGLRELDPSQGTWTAEHEHEAGNVTVYTVPVDTPRLGKEDEE